MSEPPKAPAVGQLAFDFPHLPSFADTDFLIAPCNADAVAWIERWPEWPATALALVGPSGAGKTHLARIFEQRAEARVIAVDALAGLDPIAILGDIRTAVIDDPEAVLADMRAAEGLFHLYNRLAAARGHLLITGRRPPARWTIALPDLSSRLATAAVAEIATPDDALLASILAKLFADRQIRPSAEVVHYLLARVDRSADALARVVAALDRNALARGRAVSVPLASETLRELGIAD
ncbi:MAG TPA: DnaA/Hda family protein [Alphaproteobacteria bacterium]|jgi:chromosomal replication initiation ATPase DnaA|nr:DnaA/Hda family protein [Alphaproteobacteria bacterium]